VLLPATIRNGTIYGGELELRLRNWDRFSGMLAVSSGKATGTVPSDGSSPYNSGLVLGGLAASYAAESLGTSSFNTETTEPLAASFLVRFQPMPELYVALSGRYDAGLPFGYVAPAATSNQTPPTASVQNLLDLNSASLSVASHAIFNFSAGYNLSHLGLPILISADVINIFNTNYLTEFDPIQGGTHYGTQREFLIMGELSP
jgi:hypothetical protein